MDNKIAQWSRGINLFATNLTPLDQYVRLPSYGDVKLTMHLRCYTTYLSITPLSQVEISARDIRTRLLRKEEQQEQVEVVYRRSESDTRGNFYKLFTGKK